jgi:PAS domain S-box-containing protein
MRPKFISRLRYLTALWVAGGILLACVTWACFRLGLNFATTAFIYLIVIVLLSLLDSFISSAIFSVIAVSGLDFFFTDPLFSFYVATPQNAAALVAFIVTSLAVTGLVRRLARLGDIQQAQTELLDLINDPIFVRDINDAITYWNKGAEALYGWNKEEALGKITHQLLSTVFPAPLEQITEALHGAGRWEGELLHTTRDGAKVVVESRWSLRRDGRGRPLGTIETNHDITDRKRAEEALRRTQGTYLAEAQQLSHTGSFGWDVSSGEVFWSEETYRIFGYDTEVKTSIALVLQRVHPDDVAPVQEIIDRAIKDRQEFDVEHRLLMPGGAVKHLHVVAHAVKDDPDKVQFMGAVMDITARKQAEEAVRENEQRYRDLFQYSPVALLQVDARRRAELLDGLHVQGVMDLTGHLNQHPDLMTRVMAASMVENVNQRTVEMFGARDASELLGPTTRFWRRSPATLLRAFESRFRGEPIFQEEMKVDTLDGRVIDVLVTVARPGGLDMNFIGFVDITDRVRAQEMLQQVQAEFAHAARLSMLGELTASIAHEVNQPLTAIRTNGETALRWLARSEPNLAKARESMQRILDDVRRASDVVASIRAMSAGQTPQQTALALRDVVAESIVFLRHELQSNEVSLSLDLAPALPQVNGNRTQLQQVVVNLAINAVQAVAKSGVAHRSIVIRTMQPDPESVCCMIEDSGPGIDPAHLSHLFDNFFTTKDAGMGMGLPISRSIIEAHEGQIRADNNSTLGGARFSFTLPACGSSAG